MSPNPETFLPVEPDRVPRDPVPGSGERGDRELWSVLEQASASGAREAAEGAAEVLLRQGDAVRVTYLVAEGRLRSTIGVREGLARCAAGASRLGDELAAAFGLRAARQYGECPTASARFVLMRPGLLASGREPMGFLSPRTPPPLRLAVPRGLCPVLGARLGATLAAAGAGVRLVLEVRGVALEGATLARLDGIARGDSPLRYEESGATVRSGDLVSSLVETAEAWVRTATAGIWTWWVEAGTDLEESALASIGGLLGGAGAHWRREAVEDSGADPGLGTPWLRLPRLEPGAWDPLPTGTDPARGPGDLRLGRSERHGGEVRLRVEDRAQHCYLVGASGTGKSSLLCRMILQDIEGGRGVGVLDPHGDLYAELLERIPARRLRDLVALDPGDHRQAPGINLLEPLAGLPEGRSAAFCINEMMRIFGRLYDLHLAGGPMFEKYMRNALSLVAESRIPGGSLVDVPWLFEDARYRGALLKACTNPYTVSFWRREAAAVRGEASLENMAPYVTSKLNQLTHNGVLRPIIGQPRSTVDFGACMAGRRILLVNLAKGALGTLDARLLGMLVLGKLLGEALARPAGLRGAREPFYLYVDEAQLFATETLAELLAEARKFGLHMTLANQNLGQFDGAGVNLRDALLGNVGNLLFLRLGPADASLVEGYTRPVLDAQALQFLPNFRVTARILARGEPLRPFVLHTEAPPPLPHRGPAARARRTAALTARQVGFTRPVAEVEAALRERRRWLPGQQEQEQEVRPVRADVTALN